MQGRSDSGGWHWVWGSRRRVLTVETVRILRLVVLGAGRAESEGVGEGVDWQLVLLAWVGMVGELVKRLVLCLPCALCGPEPSKARDLPLGLQVPQVVRV